MDYFTIVRCSRLTVRLQYGCGDVMRMAWIKPFVLGVALGALGVAGLGLVLKTLEPPQDILVSGPLEVVTDTHPDSLLNARLYVAEPTALAGPLYLGSNESLDLDGLYNHLGQQVFVRGEVRRRTLNTGESVLWLSPSEVTVSSP